MHFVMQNLILIAARTHFVLSKVMSQYVAFTAVHCELLLFTKQSLIIHLQNTVIENLPVHRNALMIVEMAKV